MNYRIRLHFDISIEEELQELVAAAETTLSHINALPGGLTLILTDEKRIHSLNRDYRGINAPTDVLSFPDGTRDIDTNELYYGEVFIAVPVAAEQASLHGNSLISELTLLTVHGVLHLLGHDHEELGEGEQMLSLQGEILRLLDCDITLPRPFE
jgi:probable rRNA maturation factor